MIDIPSIRREDFPILLTDAYPGKPLIYLDSAASSQKPLIVINAMNEYYKTSHANVHRGAHALAIKATSKYESARDQVHRLINSSHREEIVFTKGECRCDVCRESECVAMNYTVNDQMFHTSTRS